MHGEMLQRADSAGQVRKSRRGVGVYGILSGNGFRQQVELTQEEEQPFFMGQKPTK
nr:hypothetical protein [uncultured Acetatifactor sp.]